MSNNLSLRKDQDQDQGGSIALNEFPTTQNPIVKQTAESLATSQSLGDKVLNKALQVQQNLQDKGNQAVAKVQAEVESQVSALRKTTADGRVSIDEASLNAEVELEEAREVSRKTQKEVQEGFDKLIEADNDWLAGLKERAATQQAQTTSTFKLLAEQITGTKVTLEDLLADFE